MREIAVRLRFIGIDMLSYAVVGIPMMLALFLPVLRTRGREKRWLLVLFSLYLAAVWSAVGMPGMGRPWVFDPECTFVPFAGLFSGLKEQALNILLFVPLGFLLPTLWPRFRRLGRTILAGLILSAVIEAAQLFTFRLTDINDLITGALGTALGYWLAEGFNRHFGFYVREEGLYPREAEAITAASATVLFLVCPSLEAPFHIWLAV